MPILHLMLIKLYFFINIISQAFQMHFIGREWFGFHIGYCQFFMQAHASCYKYVTLFFVSQRPTLIIMRPSGRIVMYGRSYYVVMMLDNKLWHEHQTFNFFL